MMDNFKKCEFENCKEEADTMVFNRVEGKLMACCKKHADSIAELDYPEYLTSCPHCGCVFGVN